MLLIIVIFYFFLRHEENTLISAAEPKHYIQAATANNTRRTYRSAIRQFEAWGGQLPTNEAQVLRYLHDLAERLNPRTLSLHLTALSQWHRLQRFPDPTSSPDIRKTIKGISRLHGRPKQKAKTITLEQLERLIRFLSDTNTLKACRDRALLMLGFFGAFRRSELVGLTVQDVRWEAEGIVILLPRSKTDQLGEGKVKAIPASQGPLCPVEALRNWLQRSKITEGPIFRGITRWDVVKTTALTATSINLILKSWARLAGLESSELLSSHSLRRSLATNSYRAGASFESIKRQGGWEHEGTVRGYIDEALQFDDNAASYLLRQSNKNRNKR